MTDLTDAEVNERLALAMGWVKHFNATNAWWADKETRKPVGYSIYNEYEDETPCGCGNWDPCMDDSHMRVVRDEIERRGLERKFVQALMHSGPFCSFVDETYIFWGMQQPCAWQARAALKVLEGKVHESK